MVSAANGADSLEEQSGQSAADITSLAISRLERSRARHADARTDYGVFFVADFSAFSAFAVSCSCATTAPVIASTLTSSTPDFPGTLMSNE